MYARLHFCLILTLHMVNVSELQMTASGLLWQSFGMSQSMVSLSNNPNWGRIVAFGHANCGCAAGLPEELWTPSVLNSVEETIKPFIKCGINSAVVQHSELGQCAVSKYFCSLKADFCLEEATVNVCSLFVWKGFDCIHENCWIWCRVLDVNWFRTEGVSNWPKVWNLIRMHHVLSLLINPSILCMKGFCFVKLLMSISLILGWSLFKPWAVENGE